MCIFSHWIKEVLLYHYISLFILKLFYIMRKEKLEEFLYLSYWKKFFFFKFYLFNIWVTYNLAHPEFFL